MEQIVFSVKQQVTRLAADYAADNDDPRFCTGCVDVVAGYVRQMLTNDDVKRHRAHHAFSHGIRVAKGDKVISSGQAFEHAILAFFQDILTAGGFKVVDNRFESGTQRFTKRITQMFRKGKSRPAAESILRNKVRSVGLEYCSGLTSETGLIRKLRKTGEDHLVNALTTNDTVSSEGSAIAKRHNLAFKGDGQALVTWQQEEAYTKALKDYLRLVLDDLREAKPSDSGTTSVRAS